MYLPLSRERSRKLALILIGIGVLLSPDVIMPFPPGVDIFVNIPLAMVTADLTGLTFIESMMAIYAAAFLMILAGMLIYPYNTWKMVVGRTKAGVMFLTMNWPLAIVAVVILMVMLSLGNAFYEQMQGQILQYVEGLVR